MHSFFLRCRVLALIPLCWTATAAAFDWTDNTLGVTRGPRYTEPGTASTVQKTIFSFVHADGYRYGTNLASLRWFMSDHNNPTADRSAGAREVYFLYRHNLSLGKVLGRSVAVGPVRDFSLTAGFDVNSKNDAFGARKRSWRIGPTLDFDVPGFLSVGYVYQKESNHTRLPAPHHDIEFDGQMILAAAWGIPFRLGDAPARFQGFLENLRPKGRDYWDNETVAETLVDGAVMLDLGRYAGARDGALWAGVGYQYWRNKFGNAPMAGTRTSTPTFKAEWRF